MTHSKTLVNCNQCEMLSINGVPCHETGCPNMGSRWDVNGQEWVRQRVCFDCGCTVDYEEPCCSEVPTHPSDGSQCDWDDLGQCVDCGQYREDTK